MTGPEESGSAAYDPRRSESTQDEAMRPEAQTSHACRVDDCERPAIAKGLCSKHYDRLRRYGTTEIPARPSTCLVEDCNNPVRAKGLCNKHYKRMSRYGTTEPRQRNTHCTMPGCDRPHLAKGLCRFHYDQQRRSQSDDDAQQE